MGKATSAKKLNVLILDNDKTYIRFWEKICAHFDDCSCFCFDDVNAAKKLIKSQKIDMVISEVMLSKSDGYEVAELTHKYHPNAEVVLTTVYDCDLSRFNLKNPHFSILYKPYSDVNDIQLFINHLLHKEDVYSDVSEDSFKENELFPDVMEWKL
jgi:DNA-binding NtrC family response regulator